MFSSLKRQAVRRPQPPKSARRRRLNRCLEKLEDRQLLAGDLEFSTLYPSTSQQDGLYALVTDAESNVYISGWRDYAGAYPNYETVLSKLSPDGAVQWEQGVLPIAYEMEIDDDGLIYSITWVDQPGLPVTSDAIQSDLQGPSDFYFSILDSTQIDSDPSTLSSDELVYATYLGGTGEELFDNTNGLAIGPDGSVYLSGTTGSVDFPTTNQPSVDATLGGSRDGFLTKISQTADGSYELAFSTYFGGEARDRGNALAIDDAGVLHLTGETESSDFPTTSDGFLPSIGSQGHYAFLSRFTSDGELTYSTYVGRVTSTNGVDLAVDSDGATYLAGRTVATDYPVTEGAFQTVRAGQGTSHDAFLTKFDAQGQLEFGTFFGGSQTEAYVRVLVDEDRPVLIGVTQSEDLPLRDGFQEQYAGSGETFSFDGDSFVAGFTADGSDISFASFLGGEAGDYVYKHAVAPDGNLWLAGATYSQAFPTTDGSTFQGVVDGFLSRISLESDVSDRPLLTVENVALSEGDEGTRNAEFTFTLDSPITEDATFDYTTLNGTAVAGEDYQATSGTLTIPAGATQGTIGVPIMVDNEVEDDETFQLLITNVVNVRLSDRSPTVLIQNDDFGAFDDFDGDLPNGGVGEWIGPWTVDDDGAFTNESGPNDGQWHAIINRRGTLTRRVDTTGVSNLTLAFASKLRSFESSDKAFVRVSPDGTNWTTLKTFVNGEDDNTYRDYQFEVPFEADTLWIQFEGGMSSRYRDYWYIDTVAVEGDVINEDPPPIAVDDEFKYFTLEDETLLVTASGVLENDFDVDGQSLTARLISPTDHGAVSLNSDGSFAYVPDPDFNGSDRFTYVANDGTSDSEPATVLIQVLSVNDAPETTNDEFSVSQDSDLVVSASQGVLSNDSDVEGDELTAELATPPSHGTVTLNADGSFTYVPDAGFFGVDSFTYQAADPSEAISEEATVSITVNEVVAGPNLAHGVIEGVTGTWQTVSFGRTYNSAVVIGTPQYLGNSGPGVVRIRNVTATTFEVHVASVGSSPFTGNVHFVAVEEGVYDEPGFKLEAVKYSEAETSRKNGWLIDTTGYQQTYTSPVVVGQVMTANDPHWSVFWASSDSRTNPPTSTQLNVGKHIAEDSVTDRVAETIGYLVIEATQDGEIEGLPLVAGVGGDTVRGVENGSFQYSYTAMPNTKAAVLSAAGMDGGDGGWPVLVGANALPVDSGTIDLAFDEDQLSDAERKHTTEQVAYFVIDPPLEADPMDLNGDNQITASDALQLINRLAESSEDRSEMNQTWDVNRDGIFSALDALVVINHLRRQAVNSPVAPTDVVDEVFTQSDDDEILETLADDWLNLV